MFLSLSKVLPQKSKPTEIAYFKGWQKFPAALLGETIMRAAAAAAAFLLASTSSIKIIIWDWEDLDLKSSSSFIRRVFGPNRALPCSLTDGGGDGGGIRQSLGRSVGRPPKLQREPSRRREGAKRRSESGS